MILPDSQTKRDMPYAKPLNEVRIAKLPVCHQTLYPLLRNDVENMLHERYLLGEIG